MANAYNLSVNEIYTKFVDDVEKVWKIDVDLSPETGDIVFVIYNGSTLLVKDTDYTVLDGADTLYTITMISGHELALTDVITIQGTKGTDESDKLLIDFNEPCPTSGEVDYSFKLPVETGEYTMKLDKVDDVDFSGATASESFEVRNSDDRPVAAQSKITVLKSYLVHFTGDSITATVTLKDTGGDPVPTGGYEVSLFGDVT